MIRLRFRVSNGDPVHTFKNTTNKGYSRPKYRIDPILNNLSNDNIGNHG